MKKRESALWKLFSKAVPADAMAVRIENSLDSGTPDVLLTINHKTMLIELKCDLKISKDQSNWHLRWTKAGGRSWFLIAIDKSLYFIPGHVPLREIEMHLSNWLVGDCHEVIAILHKEGGAIYK